MQFVIKIKSLTLLITLAVLFTFFHSQCQEGPNSKNKPKIERAERGINDFLTLINSSDPKEIDQAIAHIEKKWDSAYEIMLLETIYFSQSLKQSGRLLKILEKKTGQNFGFDYDRWFEWLWNKEPSYSKEYYKFKALLHEKIDQRFLKYFLGRQDQAIIRLDEVRWGGVLQDGIPPLRGPKMISPLQATYLRDSATIFGIEVNGDVRAYPKQILAWHEMFVDTVGGVQVAGVYCTLCGTVILYETTHDGINHEMGTSGFLYRSNKLMYDRATQSLWSTLEGEPVIGPLVGKNIKLNYLSVVTTTWGEWKKRHPDTKVLSLNTGHRRDYREGVAYKDYFATDDLMFTVPKVDKRLNNKDEILALRLAENQAENLAISSGFLRKREIYQNKIGATHFTVFTDKTGAHRVYKTKGVKFVDYDGQSTVTDAKGKKWQLKENQMIASNGDTFERFPSHNAFWFGYKAAFPEVRLIK